MDVRKRAWNAGERAAVLLELATVLASDSFAQSPRRRRFLEFIVSEALANRGGQLKGYRIALEVFGKPPSFDPVLDPVVRVEAGRLRDRLREYYSGQGLTDPVVITLPKGSYAPEFEFRLPATTVPRARAAVATSDAGSPATTAKPGLAVLPFRNVSDDHENDYLADGLTDTLITDLSKVSALSVVCRQSSFACRDSGMPLAEIARRFAVRYLVLGSVQRLGQHLRIGARVIDSETDATIWADRYDREMGDLFAIEDDVCRSIVQALRITLTPREAARLGRGGTGSLEAHDALLRGLEQFWLYTRASCVEAISHFSRAAQLDPAYSVAHAWLARAGIFLCCLVTEREIPAILGRAHLHARRAVELDDQLPYAHAVLGWVLMFMGNGEEAVTEGQRACAMDPNNADAHLFLAFTLATTANGEEGLRYIATAMRLNPHPSSFYLNTLGNCHFALGQYEKAIAAMQRGIEVNPDFVLNHYESAVNLALAGRLDEARAQARTVSRLCPDTHKNCFIDPGLRARFQQGLELAGLAGASTNPSSQGPSVPT